MLTDVEPLPAMETNRKPQTIWVASGLWLALSILGFFLSYVSPASGQEPISLRVETPTGPLSPGFAVEDDRGFAAAPSEELARLGWALEESGAGVIARWKGGSPTVAIRPGNPFLSWNGEGVQLAEAPYRGSGRLFLPLQFFIDILPWKLPQVFRYDSDARLLEVRDPSLPQGYVPDSLRIVVIDPGHGGRDPGALGSRGTREKDVTLAIGEALARNLMEEPNFRVFLTRDADTLIPLWKRGELATAWKEEHPGVFISIHANAAPNARSTRGFETFFLSEARTEHERRVAALENAAQEFEREDEGPGNHSDLSFILTELRNLDHQHWSALLAEMIQDQLEAVHPGPNRGVKQGPLAVITNALMPAVLVEVGFLTHSEEERLLARRTFQEEAAMALGVAVREFFRRYPSGGGLGLREESP